MIYHMDNHQMILLFLESANWLFYIFERKNNTCVFNFVSNHYMYQWTMNSSIPNYLNVEPHSMRKCKCFSHSIDKTIDKTIAWQPCLESNNLLTSHVSLHESVLPVCDIGSYTFFLKQALTSEVDVKAIL